MDVISRGIQRTKRRKKIGKDRLVGRKQGSCDQKRTSESTNLAVKMFCIDEDLGHCPSEAAEVLPCQGKEKVNKD